MRLTLSIDDKVAVRAREVARQQGTTINALVREYLERLAGTRSGQTVAEQFEAMWNERSGHSGGWRFNREEIYEERLNAGAHRRSV